MGLLDRIWPKGNLKIRRQLSPQIAQELVHFISLLPLAATDLRAEISPAVTCSDASEEGGGLCVSGSLTAEGASMLRHLQSAAYLDSRLSCFRPHGAMPSYDGGASGPRVVVVSLFDGVAALMCALCRLRCQIVAFGSSEIDKDCKRLVRRRWPGVIELGNAHVDSISDDTIASLSKSVGGKVDLVLVGAKSPLQDLPRRPSDAQQPSEAGERLFYFQFPWSRGLYYI